MSGGKGGSSTTEVKVPQYIEDAARANLARADEISKIGYTPYYGPDVAAFTPMQQSSFQNTSDMASAFGLATPMSQQDIYGGMPAPTSYAGGVQGYSSAPMFEQSMAELEARRPGQYAAINAPFIDPVTGAQPAAPFQGGTALAAAREAEAAAAATGQPYISGADYGGRDMDYGGNGGGVGYTGLRDTIDGGGPNASTIGGRGFQGPNPDGSAGNDGGGDKVICTALHELGRLSDDMYALDAQFGLRVNREDPMLGDGYRLWATSVANYIKGDSIGSKVALAIVSPVAKAWAAEMAHVMRPDDYKSNIFGKALMAVGHPICRMIGKVFLPKLRKETV
jgi:hypothetical protein